MLIFSVDLKIMSFPQNERLLSAVESGDIFSVRKLVKESTLLLDVNVREYYPFGECALSKAVKGKDHT